MYSMPLDEGPVQRDQLVAHLRCDVAGAENLGLSSVVGAHLGLVALIRMIFLNKTFENTKW